MDQQAEGPDQVVLACHASEHQLQQAAELLGWQWGKSVAARTAMLKRSSVDLPLSILLVKQSQSLYVVPDLPAIKEKLAATAPIKREASATTTTDQEVQMIIAPPSPTTGRPLLPSIPQAAPPLPPSGGPPPPPPPPAKASETPLMPETLPLEVDFNECPCKSYESLVVAHARISYAGDRDNAVLIESGMLIAISDDAHPLVIVQPWARGKGLGRRIMEVTEQVARECGAREVCLSTHDQVPFYTALGYRESTPVTSLGSNAHRIDGGQLKGLLRALGGGSKATAADAINYGVTWPSCNKADAPRRQCTI